MTINYPARKKNNAEGTTTRDVNAAVRAQTALKLKLEGKNWDEVAAQAGYQSRGSAHHAVMRELERCITHDVKELRDQQLYILLQLQARCYKEGMNEKSLGWGWAVDRAEKLSKRISELMGLDVKVESDVMAAQIIIQEVPQNYLEGPKE